MVDWETPKTLTVTGVIVSNERGRIMDVDFTAPPGPSDWTIRWDPAGILILEPPKVENERG